MISAGTTLQRSLSIRQALAALAADPRELLEAVLQSRDLAEARGALMARWGLDGDQAGVILTAPIGSLAGHERQRSAELYRRLSAALAAEDQERERAP